MVPQERSDAKQRLLEKFLRGEVSRQNWEVPIEPRADGSPVPLAPGQHLIYLSAKITAPEPVYNAPFTIHHRGPLDPEVLQRAFEEVVRRHEILRTTFASVGDQVVQAVHDHLTIQIPFLDLSNLPEHQREQEAIRVAEADGRRVLDPSLGPLLRARLVKMEAEYYRLYLTAHLIIFDGVSIYNALLPELAAIYKAFAAGEPSTLQEPRYQYSDFALWQKRMLDNDSAARQIDYWRAQLAGELPDLQLPGRPRPAVHPHRGAMKAFVLPAKLTAAVKAAAHAEGATAYMFLLATFKTLLHRYSGQEDIMIGGLSGTRRRPEFQKLIGNFSNFFALRTRPSADAVFRDYMAQVKDCVLGALANNDVPLDQVIREVDPRLETGGKPLFQVTFCMEPRADSDVPGWYVTQMETDTGATKFDLYCEIDERAGGLFGRFIYSTGRFDAAMIDRMVGHWLTLLQAAIDNPDAKLGELNTIPEAEHRQLRSDWNSTGREIPNVTVHELIEFQAARTPEAIAVEAAGVRLTYRELNERANRLARRLRHAGVLPGTVVGLCVERTVNLIVAPLAVLKAGGCYLPLDPEFPKERLACLMKDAKAPLVLTASSLVGQLPQTGARIVFCDDSDADPANLTPAATPEALSCVLYTSGSKSVGIHHRALVNLLLSLQREPGFTSSDSLLAVTTLSLDIAQVELYLPLISGGRLVVASNEDTRDPGRLSHLLRESKCSVLQATPELWRGLIDSGWSGQAGLKALSGEPLARDLAERLAPSVDQLWNLYGFTETTIWATVHRVAPGNGAVPIGHPIENTEIYVFDTHRKLAPIGVPGEMYIGGAGLAAGYGLREELIAEHFVPHPFDKNQKLYRTGDLGRWLGDGTLEYLSRIDDQFQLRGFRVDPAEIEAALLEHPEIRGAAVRAWPDASGNLSINAYVTGAPKGDLRRFLEQKLPAYMIPARFVLLDALPLRPGGRVARHALPKPASAEKTVQTPAQLDETERKLVAIWESVLDVRPIGVEDNFFDLGGYSFQVAKLLRKIEAEFGTRLSMAAVFEAPTVSRLAKLLGDRSLIARVSRTSTLQPAGTLEPLLWIYGGPIVRSLASNLGTQRPFLGVGLEHGENADLAGCTFAEFAARLRRLIRATQPHGPYYLGGWCISGLLAYEVASQLIDDGEEVGLVVMLDAPNPAHYFKISKYRLLESKAAYQTKRLLKMGIREAISRVPERTRAFLDQIFAKRSDEESPFHVALHTAATTYNPKPIPARVLALQPNERPAIWDLRESWAAHLQQSNFEVRDVPGDHVTMLAEPHVAAVAACIRDGLRSNVREIRRVG